MHANLIAKGKGIVINKAHIWESKDLVYASLVTLRALGLVMRSKQIILGYMSKKSIYISWTDWFTDLFVLEGTLVVLHHYDEPGKIGGISVSLLPGLH